MCPNTALCGGDMLLAHENMFLQLCQLVTCVSPFSLVGGHVQGDRMFLLTPPPSSASCLGTAEALPLPGISSPFLLKALQPGT
jgi:hypothetical protein